MKAMNGAVNAENVLERCDTGGADIKQTTTQMPEPDPEQLLKMIDAQLSLARSQRLRKTDDARLQFRIWSLVFIIGGTIVAFWVLQFTLSQMAPVRILQQNASVPPVER
jgi:hypothetical protein